MWLFFNKNYQSNKRRDVVFITDIQKCSYLIGNKIAQKIDNPHEVINNIKIKLAKEE